MPWYTRPWNALREAKWWQLTVLAVLLAGLLAVVLLPWDRLGAWLLPLLVSWARFACESPGLAVVTALIAVGILTVAIVACGKLLGAPEKGPVTLERSLHSFYAAVQYGSILVLSVLTIHAVARDCCAVSKDDGFLLIQGALVTIILFISALATHNKKKCL